MSYRRQLRRDLERARLEQVEQVMAARMSRATVAGATLHRLDDDGQPTGEVIRLDGDAAAELLDDADVELLDEP